MNWSKSAVHGSGRVSLTSDSGFDLVNMFFLLFPFNRIVPFLFLLLRLFVPDFCHFVISFTREILVKQSLKKAIFSSY